ncbi:MAG: hypothetical protein SVY53_10700 [Chloroflexota bacterium]|nr:hypothetical protein [Chloroflexota bacterium]
MTEYEDCIVFLLAKAHQRAQGNIKNRLQVYGITHIQHLVLEALWDEEWLSAIHKEDISFDAARTYVRQNVSSPPLSNSLSRGKRTWIPSTLTGNTIITHVGIGTKVPPTVKATVGEALASTGHAKSHSLSGRIAAPRSQECGPHHPLSSKRLQEIIL